MGNPNDRIVANWEYYAVLQHYSSLYKNIYVTISIDSYKNGNIKETISKKESRRICDHLLTPLCKEADEVSIYGNISSDVLSSWDDNLFKKQRGKISLTSDNIASYLPGLVGSDKTRIGGTLLFKLHYDEILLKSIFSSCFDPKVLAGLGSVCTKTAVSYAKKNSNDDVFFALLSEANAGFQWLFFIASDETRNKLVRLMGLHCQSTDAFMEGHGPGTKFSPLGNKASYGTGGHE